MAIPLPNEENGYTRVILGPDKTKVVFEVVQPGMSDGIPINLPILQVSLSGVVGLCGVY